MRENLVIIAEDDLDDQEIIKEAFSEIGMPTKIEYVSDGECLTKELEKKAASTNGLEQKLPDIIFLDLNMPKKSGFEVLKFLRNHNLFKQIPIIVFTTSQADEDILDVYKIGANSFIHKPSTFGEMVEVLSATIDYWFNVVRLPNTILNLHQEASACS